MPTKVKTTMELETITPEMAEKYLMRNITNRKVQSVTVALYARLMTQGDWMVNGESIKFNEEGELADGQHRLLSVIKTGIPLTTWVARGLPMEAQLTIDQQRKRTAGDMLAMRGIPSGNAIAACVRMVARWNAGERSMFGFNGSQGMLTAKEVVSIAEADPIYVEAAHRAGLQSLVVMCPPRVISTMYVLFSRLDTLKTEEFFASLVTGSNLPEGHPVLTLRRYWLRLSQSGKRVGQSAIFLMAGVRAWNAYVEGRDLSQMAYKKTDIPEIRVPEPASQQVSA